LNAQFGASFHDIAHAFHPMKMAIQAVLSFFLGPASISIHNNGNMVRQAPLSILSIRLSSILKRELPANLTKGGKFSKIKPLASGFKFCRKATRPIPGFSVSANTKWLMPNGNYHFPGLGQR
jgi:peptidoglycan biosynthesis protein MviN/MurJ (putative lipid II flippase)